MTAGSTETYNGRTDANGDEYWAKIPSSIIVGEIGEGLSPQARSIAFHLYVYLDLMYNTRSWAVVGYRDISTRLGWDERTVSKYVGVLAVAGLVEVEQEGKKAARIRLIHNPARGRNNPKAQVGPARELYCHQKKAYREKPEQPTSGEPHYVQYDSHEMRFADGIPTAHDAGGPISPICGFSSRPIPDHILELTDPREKRCAGCGLLLSRPVGRPVLESELCPSRPF